MSKPPFYAKDHSLNAQSFLYACAFWTVAGDEQLKPAEQDWLESQFGAAGATRSLDEFVALESDAFFQAFDTAAKSLTDGEKRAVYPRLEAWLLSCARADGAQGEEEMRVIEKIKERLSLDAEIRRLMGPIHAKEDRKPKPASQTEIKAVRPPESKHGSLLAPGPVSFSREQGGRLLQGHTTEVNAVRISPDGRLVLSASNDGEVKLWDFQQGTELRTCSGHELGASDVCFHPDGGRFVSGDRLGTLRLWKTGSGELIWARHTKGYGGITSLDVSPDGKRIVFTTDIGLIRICDLENGREILKYGAKRLGAMRAACFSPDGKTVLTGEDDRTAKLWDASNGSELKTLAGHEDGVTSVAFARDGKSAVTGSRDNTVKLWELDSGKEIKTFEGHSFNVCGVDFSPDGKRVVSASWDHTIKVWDVASGRERFNLESVHGRFNGVRFHPDGEHILAGSSEDVIHIVRLPKE